MSFREWNDQETLRLLEVIIERESYLLSVHFHSLGT